MQAKEDRILLAEARLRQVDHRLLRVDHRRRQAALHRASLILRGLRAKGRPLLISRVRPRVHREQMARGIHRDRHRDSQRDRQQHHRQLPASMQPEAHRLRLARLLPISLLMEIVVSQVAVDSAMQ